MELLELRKNLVEMSGRYDLVDENWNSQGADFYINAGLKYLDKMTDIFPMSIGRMTRTVNPGQYLVQVDLFRYIESVHLILEDSKSELEKIDYDQIIEKFPKADIENIDSDEPKFYVPGSFRIDETGLYLDGSFDYDSILVLPPPVQTRQIVVHAHFFSKPLTEDYHTNGWASKNPNVLLMAAMREMEIFHRNTQGQQDWESAIMREVRNIQMDRVSEEIVGINKMEG